MNYALIFAGGTGRRMNSRTKPKQFLELHCKPVIIFTMEHFSKHPEIDGIFVACVENWLNELQHFIKQFYVDKIINVIAGSAEGADKSIFLGLKAMREICAPDDIVLIHDGVRPLITESVISANIAKVKECGNCITVDAATESVVRLDGGNKVVEVPPRREMFFAKAPQSFKFKNIYELYCRADADAVRTIDSAHLCNIYGVEMHTALSTPNNIKITAPQDYYIFRALYEAMENQQIIGI